MKTERREKDRRLWIEDPEKDKMGPRGGGEHGATPTSSLLGPERRERNGQRDMKERKKR